MGFFSSIAKLFRGSTAPEPDTAGTAPAPTTETLPPAVPEAEEVPTPVTAPIPPTATPEAQPLYTPEVKEAPASAIAPIPPATVAEAEPPTIAEVEKAPTVAPTSTSQNTGADNTALTLALRQADPKLSAWLDIVLQGVTKADGLFWERITFLLQSLEAPQDEIQAFTAQIRAWLDDMGYENLEDFRSELQYRLALALDVEDEEDERSRLFTKLSAGLAKTRDQISRNLNSLFNADRAINDEFWEELEETLIMADVGYETAIGLTERIRRQAESRGITDASKLKDLMKEALLEVFKPIRRISATNPPEVILVIGVNGVGKTTTIAKLCYRSTLQGKKVFLVAGDTFRAAATEQLEIWAKRTGAGFYAKGHGADPAAVAYEAMEKAMQDNYDMVFIDTAGRLHTKANLMEELAKIRRVISKQHQGAPHRTILVLDATTGQNGLSQIKLFHESCGIDELIFTKLDGTAKGGIAVAAAMQFGIPISFVGLGEKMEDLRPFDAEGFVSALLDI